MGHLPENEDVRIGVEATGPYWIPLTNWLKSKGWQPVVLNPIKTSSLRNYGVRGNKTDRIDSVLIAHTLRWEDKEPKEEVSKQAEELRPSPDCELR